MKKLLLLILLSTVIAGAALYAVDYGEGNREETYFIKADQYYEEGRFEKSAEVYQEYLNKFPKGNSRDEALFMLGRVLYYTLDKKAEAVRHLGVLVNEHPASDFAFQARQILAGAFRDEAKDYGRAILEYKWLIAQKPDHPKTPYFQFQIARCYLLAQDLKQAILEFGRFIEKYPDSEYIERAYDELASAHLVLGRADQALFIFRTMLERFPDTEYETAVEFKIGNALEELYRFKEALKMYESLLDRYENRQAVEIRIAGVKKRQKERLGGVKDVDYNYRPSANDETLRNFKEKKKKGQTSSTDIKGLTTKERKAE
jgi:TolA-binding protein